MYTQRSTDGFVVVRCPSEELNRLSTHNIMSAIFTVDLSVAIYESCINKS